MTCPRLMVLLAVATAGACAHRATPKLNTYDLHSGYRFERIAVLGQLRLGDERLQPSDWRAVFGERPGLRSDSAVAARRSRRHLFGVGW